MGDQKRNWQQDLKVFRERVGGLVERKKVTAKLQREREKAVLRAFQKGPLTIPALEKETGIPSPELVWFVMAMKRYGQLVEAGDDGMYIQYRLKEPRP